MKQIIFVVLLLLAIFVLQDIFLAPLEKKKFLPLISSLLSGKRFDARVASVTNKNVPCPDPFIFAMPIDMSKVTSILYPGQIRGGDYKAHGGFRFDKSRPDEIIVKAPYDAYVFAGARYPVGEEIQYTFDFAHPCGVRYRFGHLLTLTPKFQTLAEKFPLPKGLDSRTTQIEPPVMVRQGEIIATAVGLTKGGPEALNGLNTFVDWGVYDYRQKNEVSQNPSWASSHPQDTYQYAVCWFNWISPENRTKVLALPSSDPQSGKQSDYCQ